MGREQKVKQPTTKAWSGQVDCRQRFKLPADVETSGRDLESEERGMILPPETLIGRTLGGLRKNRALVVFFFRPSKCKEDAGCPCGRRERDTRMDGGRWAHRWDFGFDRGPLALHRCRPHRRRSGNLCSPRTLRRDGIFIHSG